MKQIILTLLIATSITHQAKAMEYVWPATQVAAGAYATFISSRTLYDIITQQGSAKNMTTQVRNYLLFLAAVGYINAHATIYAGLSGIAGSK